jgi:hypothetical protein
VFASSFTTTYFGSSFPLPFYAFLDKPGNTEEETSHEEMSTKGDKFMHWKPERVSSYSRERDKILETEQRFESIH